MLSHVYVDSQQAPRLHASKAAKRRSALGFRDRAFSIWCRRKGIPTGEGQLLGIKWPGIMATTLSSGVEMLPSGWGTAKTRADIARMLEHIQNKKVAMRKD